jgi:tRNA pseudouridine38-40 synthase
MRFRLIIAYDGTPFSGWQSQNNSIAIQPLIEKALSVVLREEISIVGAGRTDAGVHAFGQIAHFDTSNIFEDQRVRLSLNALLPPEIRILDIQRTDDKFHARYDAKGKIYHYRLHLDRTPDPFKRLYSHHVLYRLDLNALAEAAMTLVGKHDFRSFANEADEGSASKNSIRTLKRIDTIPEQGGIRLEFEGDGFLYKMVRNITGTLLDVARGKIPLSSLLAILESKDRRAAGPSAPAHGLSLVKVIY